MGSYIVYDAETLTVRSIARNSTPHTREMREAAMAGVPGNARALWTRDDLGDYTPDRDRLHLPTPDDPRLYVERVPEPAEERDAREQRATTAREAARLDALARALADLQMYEKAASDPRTKDAANWQPLIDAATQKVEELKREANPASRE